MLIVNGTEGGPIDARDRGFTYGDGVFRTFPMSGGHVPHWDRQFTKLASDCAALRLACPSRDHLEADLATIGARHPDGVVRITVTRGVAQRGYAISDQSNVTRAVLWSAFNPGRNTLTSGVRARWCDLRLGIQPALAGIKHLNRLENVLARSEWNDPAIAEGLLCDVQDNVIGGTMSNLFLQCNGVLMTPALDACGIAGVTRELVIERARAEQLNVEVRSVDRRMVNAAEAVFLVNSVIGVWQVIALGDRSWSANPWLERLRGWIANG